LRKLPPIRAWGGGLDPFDQIHWRSTPTELVVGAALLAWNAIASELDGDIQTVQ
jgi:hypothetical protein